MVIPQVMILDHGHVAIVQHEPGSIEPGRDNGVIFFADVVPQDDNPKVIRGNSRLLQSNELCNRVIFAVSGTPGERVEGRTPDVLDTVKRQIAHRLYGQIDCAVDLAESRTTVQISSVFNNVQKLKRCLRLTRRAVLLANLQHSPFTINLAFDAKPGEFDGAAITAEDAQIRINPQANKTARQVFELPALHM